jgi:3-(3-hydroxy-phenyl)propionate hydroxylase
MKKHARVAIAGGGPVGCVAALILARAGVDVVLFEMHPTPQEDLRASTFHPPTLEMLDTLGLSEKIHEMGLKAPVYQYRNRQTGDILPFDLSELSDMTRFPWRLQCEQWKLTRHVCELLEAEPHARVMFSRRAITFDQDESGVTTFVESPYAIESYRTDYLIACDGANSIIRKWMGIEFDGFTYPEKFLTISTDWPIEDSFENLAFVNYVADPEEWMVLLRVPSLWRVLVPAVESESDDYLLSDEKKNIVFRSLLGEDDKVRTAHRTIYRVHQRVAQTYRSGRVLLAGDAAHLNNPLGGLGMNSGLHDAFNLCGKLIAILKEQAPDSLLDAYVRQRRTVMQNFVQSQTIKNKAELEQRDASAQKRRQQEMTNLLRDDARRRDYLLTQSMFKSLELERSIQ